MKQKETKIIFHNLRLLIAFPLRRIEVRNAYYNYIFFFYNVFYYYYLFFFFIY